MSARVNLLPPELAQRARAARVRTLVVVAVAGWVAVLALLYVLKLGAVADVQRELESEQDEVAQLEQQVAALDEFAQLDAELTARNALLAAALDEEVAWARVLNDLALAFPSNASLLTLTATTAGAPVPGAVPDAVGTGVVSFTGYSVEEFAPGVEAVLLRLNDVRGLTGAYLAQASEELRGDTSVTTFSGSADLDDDVFTERYAEGLPPELDE